MLPSTKRSCLSFWEQYRRTPTASRYSVVHNSLHIRTRLHFLLLSPAHQVHRNKPGLPPRRSSIVWHPLDINVCILQPSLKIFATFLDSVVATAYVSDRAGQNKVVTVCFSASQYGHLGFWLTPHRWSVWEVLACFALSRLAVTHWRLVAVWNPGTGTTVGSSMTSPPVGALFFQYSSHAELMSNC